MILNTLEAFNMFLLKKPTPESSPQSPPQRIGEGKLSVAMQGWGSIKLRHLISVFNF